MVGVLLVEPNRMLMQYSSLDITNVWMRLSVAEKDREGRRPAVLEVEGGSFSDPVNIEEE